MRAALHAPAPGHPSQRPIMPKAASCRAFRPAARWPLCGYNRRMPEHVGIVGCSAEGAALCYRTLCLEGEASFGVHAHPEVSLHSHSLGTYMGHIRAHDWPAVGELMLDSARKLARAGADFLICPDNTIHEALPGIRARS